MAASFVHLHVHTEYSIKDSIVRIKKLAEKASGFEMPAVALTDHGNLFGAVPFTMQMRSVGVKPILGCEVYVAPASLNDKKEIVGRKRSTHLTLLAKNEEGWKNLMKLVSVGHLDGEYMGEPRVDREVLARFSEGIICLSGCKHGPLHEWLEDDNVQAAEDEARALMEIYGKQDFYIELMDHAMESDQRCIEQLVGIAKTLGAKVVATNDVHFLEPDEHAALDCLICIGEGKLLLDEDRKSYPTQVYFKSAEEMRELFKDIPEACDNTLEIAEKCNVELKLDPTATDKYPQFDARDGSPREEYLKKVCFDGLEKRYPERKLKRLAEMQKKTEVEMLDTLHERLNYEIGIINNLGFSSYFLITADFINWAREQEIPVGPGRGSAAGSLVAYTMGITDICPMRFGLLFERFLNPERVSPPDVDIDFCQTRRMEVIDYVRDKYSERCVSHIITFGTLGAKSAIRDVARVVGLSYGDADRLAKLIDGTPGKKITLKGEYKEKEELREIVDASSSYQEVWDYATKLEGLNRNTGVHAAGVVIGDGDLDRHVPLARAKEGEVVAQADMNAITEIGLLKMDFLGLKNLTVIQDAVNFVRAHIPEFDILEVDLDDRPTLELLNRGETMGVFQLESGGMVETCKKYGIDKIEDIIDLLALYRPGAMQFMDQMIDVKKGVKEVSYEHPLLEDVCGDTFGVMIYQEQVQNAAKLLAGYTLGGADVLRRAMGKKKESVMAEQRQTFIKGCREVNDIDESLANKIFDKIASFAGYGFNKSHSACYGHISYWTAYLKANFPVEFLCGLLSNEMNNTEKIGVFISECHRMGIEVLPPCINRSELNFTPEQMTSGVWAVRYGLGAIKNVGEGAMKMLIEERQKNGLFESMEELTNRLSTKIVNKKILENLIKAGAMDFAPENRATLMHKLENVIAAASSSHRDRDKGQASMFDALDITAAADTQEDDYMAEWPKQERLEAEKELLGFYTSGHPLDSCRAILMKPEYTGITLLDEVDISDPKKKYQVAGIVKMVTHKVSKAGKKFGILALEDLTGSREMLLFSKTYESAVDAGVLEEGLLLKMEISVKEDDRGERRSFFANRVTEIRRKRQKKGSSQALQINLWTGRHGSEELQHIYDAIKKYPGKKAVQLLIKNSLGQREVLELPPSYSVRHCADLKRELEKFL